MALASFAKHAHPEQTTLVFPATHPDGRTYLEEAHKRGERVLAASSVRDAEQAAELKELVILPYINDPTFPHQFSSLVEQHRITRVLAPVAAVYLWLERFISESGLAVHLLGDSPIKQEMARFNKLMATVARYQGFIDHCAEGTNDLSTLEMAAVFRLASSIYGESNEQKIAAIMAIFSSAPKGDVVEIGSLVGKSAAVLALLAARYRVGNVLAIDPWERESARQHDSPLNVQGAMVDEWEIEMVPQDFVINLLPVGLGRFNYLRQASAKGYEIFREQRMVESQEFGRVEYRGKLALIHIDGNHDYISVQQDCGLWLALLAPHGWLILDDYLWAHGDGPRRVGDALLKRYAADIERAFVCGNALFVKFGADGQRQ
ncbi:MAG: class I SAM-dependent methyltransferase [Accumulibacter sp.]|uniref:class I SAM-dependent methyltransferase n=1 Tax=Accumulibacter sp. TaxID=2053492 RepID=UPI0033151A17